MKIARIAGEAFDADLVETPEFTWPHYPECPVCENETDDARGYCSDCEQFADGRLSDEPPSELKRNGTTGEWM